MMHKFNVGDLVVGAHPVRSGCGYDGYILKVNEQNRWGNGDLKYHLSPIALPYNGIGYDEPYLRKANVFDHIREQFNKFFKRGYYSAKWQR